MGGKHLLQLTESLYPYSNTNAEPSVEELAEASMGLPAGRPKRNGGVPPVMLASLVNHVLTDRQRDCVLLYYYQHQNMQQIADCLQLNVSTVCRHLQRARKRLGAVLSFYFPDQQDIQLAAKQKVKETGADKPRLLS